MRTMTGSGSALAKERTACVAWPLTSFTPKISLLGNEAVTWTDSCGRGSARGSSTISSTCTCEIVSLKVVGIDNDGI